MTYPVLGNSHGTNAQKSAKKWVVAGVTVVALSLVATGSLLVVKGLLARKGTSSETWAYRYLRQYAEAQSMFKRHDWDSDHKLEYANPYDILHSTVDASGRPIELIEADFARARGKDGAPLFFYLFEECKTIAGNRINGDTDYALSATPARYGTGRHTLIIRTDGVIWTKDLGKSEFIADFPASPAAEGWVEME